MKEKDGVGRVVGRLFNGGKEANPQEEPWMSLSCLASLGSKYYHKEVQGWWCLCHNEDWQSTIPVHTYIPKFTPKIKINLPGLPSFIILAYIPYLAVETFIGNSRFVFWWRCLDVALLWMWQPKLAYLSQPSGWRSSENDDNPGDAQIQRCYPQTWSHTPGGINVEDVAISWYPTVPKTRRKEREMQTNRGITLGSFRQVCYNI